MTQYKRARWSKEEDDYLREHYPWNPIKDTVEKLNRSKSAVVQRASQLGLSSQLKKERAWSDEDIQFLEWAIKELGIQRCAEVIGRSVSAVKCACRRHSIDMSTQNPDWTQDDVDLIKGHVGFAGLQDIASSLGRSLEAVLWKAREVGIEIHSDMEDDVSDAESPDMDEVWNPQDDEALLYMSSIGQDWQKIAQILNRTPSSARYRLSLLSESLERETA